MNENELTAAPGEVPQPVAPPPPAGNLQANPKLAFSLREAAYALGVSYITVQRLVKRGLLKSSSALRTKVISREELERFLRETTQ